MTLFDPSEKVEFIATQSLHYDNYSGCQYYLERVDVQGKCGLGAAPLIPCSTTNELDSLRLSRYMFHLAMEEGVNDPLRLSFRWASPCGTQPDDDCHHKRVCSRSDHSGKVRHVCLPE